MGLLTADTAGGHGIVARTFKNHANYLNFLCISLAIAASIALVTENLVDKTYFSDNALLPGLVKREFNLKTYLDKVNEELNNEARLSGDQIPHSYLLKQFKSIGLHAYSHNFTHHYPFLDKPVSNFIA